VIAVTRTPWSKIEPAYRFVAEMEALRSLVKGAGNLERFDYWLDTTKFAREMARLACARGHLDHVMAQVNKGVAPVAKEKPALERALAAKRDVIETAGEMYEALLGAMCNSSELGTLANVEQQSFLRCKYLAAHDDALAKALGTKLPADALPPKAYAGEPRLIVPERRTQLREGEVLTLRVIILDNRRAKSATLYRRPMGRGPFKTIDLVHKARAVYTVTLPPARGDAIEYYIKAETASGGTLRWPATAPGLNHTVVVH
jgi:hypothetical protein